MAGGEAAGGVGIYVPLSNDCVSVKCRTNESSPLRYLPDSTITLYTVLPTPFYIYLYIFYTGIVL